MNVPLISRFGTWLSAHRRLAMILTAVFGLCFGAWLYYQSIAPRRPQTVRQLIRGLQKRDTRLNDLYQLFWALLPDMVTTRLSSLEPRPAADTRTAAAFDLGRRGSAARPALPALVTALHDPLRAVSWAVIWALRELGPDAKSAAPGLLAFFNDPALDSDLEMRALVGAALVAIASDELPLGDSFVAVAAEHRNPDFRAQILGLIGTLKPPPPRALRLLSASLESTNATIRDAAVRALGDVGPPAVEAVPVLTNLYEKLHQALPPEVEGDPLAGGISAGTPVRVRYGISFSSNLSQIPPPLTSAMPNPNLPPTPAAAAGTVATFMPDSSTPNSPAPFMKRYGIVVSRFETRQSQIAIIETLGKIGPPAKAALPLLIRESTNLVRLRCYQGILARWQIEQDPQFILPDLIAMLHNHLPTQDRCLALEYLEKMGSLGLPTIISALSQEDTSVRFTAVRALGRFGPAAHSSIPQLEQIMQNDPKFGIRLAAEGALKKIQPASAARWKAVRPPGFPADFPRPEAIY